MRFPVPWTSFAPSVLLVACQASPTAATKTDPATKSAAKIPAAEVVAKTSSDGTTKPVIGATTKTEVDAKNERPAVASSAERPPAEAALADSSAENSEQAGEARLESAPSPPTRYSHRECSECEDQASQTCLFGADAAGEQRAMGCGTASPNGNFAVVARETGSLNDSSWALDYLYYSPKGLLRADERVCVGEVSFDCLGPGRFLALGDGGWMQHMGNAGDGTNDQAIRHLAAGGDYKLPRGEYTLVEHPSGDVAGFFSCEPNVYDADDKAHLRLTLGCFDVRTKTTHVLWTKLSPESDDNPYVYADTRWSGDILEIYEDDAGVLERAACPPAS